jgi:predicted DNA-binding ArsR family transcriptional regulator
MAHAKLINEVTDLVWLLRGFDTDLKKKIFNEILSEWKTVDSIVEKFGDEGIEALSYFEKIKLVETRWAMPEDEKPKKEYRANYNSFHIRIVSSIDKISDAFAIALMDDKEFSEIEKKIYDWIGTGKMGREVEIQYHLSSVKLKAIVKRSDRLVYKGMMIEKI